MCVNMKFPGNIREKIVASNNLMLYSVINAINVCIFPAITYLDFVIGNFRKTVHLGIARFA